MRKILIVLALVVTAGFFACSDLPSDMDMKNVERVVDESLPTITLYSYSGGDNFFSNDATTGTIKIHKKETTVSDFLNKCLKYKKYKKYKRCMKRKVRKLIKKGYITAETGAEIIAWAKAQK